MRKLFKRIIFVSNSHLNKNDEAKIKKYSDTIIERDNIGYDFGAWKETFTNEGWDTFLKYDNVTLMNDTCFGPLHDMGAVFEDMEQENIDFWGITNHKKNEIPETDTTIPEHLQSYFLSFSKNIVLSEVFQAFWETSHYLNDVKEVINLYEIRLTRLLTDAGFRYRSYLDTVDCQTENPDLANWHPDMLIKKGNPFVKIKSILNFKNPVYIKQLIARFSSDPVDLIDDFFSKSFPPDETILLSNKTLLVPDTYEKISAPQLKTAIHIHAYYPEVLSPYFTVLKDAASDFDLYITTDTPEKKNIIASMAVENNLDSTLKEILFFKNKGRNVLPWLTISDMLARYDIAGHFHTKKTDWLESWVGDSWQNEIIDTLILPMDQIISFFHTNPEIGIIIPDKPFYYTAGSHGADIWGANRELFQSLWQKMKCSKKIDPYAIKNPVMPVGNMFWYRPCALKKLFDLKLNDNGFPSEPLPVDGTIAHALERMPLYIAWDENFDFRIAVQKNMLKTSFQEKIIFVEKQTETHVNPFFYVSRKIYRSVKKILQ
jgi:rhamnosyltransferase